MAFGYDDAAILLAQILPSLLGGGGESDQVSGLEPSDAWGRQQTRLLPAGSTERELSTLQAILGGSAFRAGAEPMPGGLSLENLTAGNISPGSQRRIHTAAFAPVQEGLRMASRQAEEEALARGIPMSSMQGTREAELQRPLLAGAAGTEAQLGLAEMNRLEGLRQNQLGNMLALQQSPALDRLLQIRMAEAERTNLQETRFPGGLPEGAYRGNEQSDTEREQASADQVQRSREQRNNLYQQQIMPLEDRYRALIDENRRIMEALRGSNSSTGKRRLQQLLERNAQGLAAISGEITRLWPNFDFDRSLQGLRQLEEV